METSLHDCTEFVEIRFFTVHFGISFVVRFKGFKGSLYANQKHCIYWAIQAPECCQNSYECEGLHSSSILSQIRVPYIYLWIPKDAATATITFGVTWFGFAASPVREMEQRKLFSGCLLWTHCWPIMGFSSSLTRISETNNLALPVFPCRLSGLQWHSLVILILEARKKSLMKHSDGSGKHAAIMKLQHSHMVLAGGCSVQTH